MPGSTSWDITRARTFYDSGMPLDRIAARVGVPATTLARYARRNGWPIRPRHPNTAPIRAGRAVLPAFGSAGLDL